MRMKKIFTLLMTCLLGCVASVKADEVKVYLEDEDGNQLYKSYSTELTYDKETGGFTLANFVDASNTEFTFKFDPNMEVNSYTGIEILSNSKEDEDDYVYVLNQNSKYPYCYVYGLTDDEKIRIRYPQIYNNKSYTYIYRCDKEEYGYDYYACINLCGWDADLENWFDLCVTFYFNMPTDKPSVEIPENAEDVKLEICNFQGKQIAEPFEASIWKNDEGNYVIYDFLNSDTSFEFSLKKKLNVDDTCGINIAGKTYIDSDYPEYVYLLNSSEKYPSLKFTPVDGSTLSEVEYPCVYNDPEYSYVLRVDQADNNGYNYMARLSMVGFDADDNDVDFYVYFYFDTTKIPGTPSNVDVIGNDNAPVEYFNLQGVKVTNPENGMFIRRQGNEVKKVVIR